eukprot:sb/3464187/
MVIPLLYNSIVHSSTFSNRDFLITLPPPHSLDAYKRHGARFHPTASSIRTNRNINTNRDKPVFICPYCNVTFNIQSNLYKHVEKMHSKPPDEFQEYKYSCELCGNKFLTHETYARHVEKFHDSARVGELRGGGQGRGDRGEDLDMTEISLTEFISQTDVDVAFPASEEYSIGRKIGVFPCEDCGYVYNCEYNLKRHRKEKHAVILKRVKCPYCGKLFVREDTLIKHIQRVHQQDERCICIHCGADFYRYNSLRRHILTKHRTEKNHRCCLCEKEFSFGWELTIHHQNNHVTEPGYPCDQCSKRFKRPQTLSEHKKFVHDNMRVVCAIDDCRDIFNTMASFKKHKMLAHVTDGTNKRGPQPAADKTVSYRIVHAETIEEKMCRHCFQEFPSLVAMKRHVAQEHSDLQNMPSAVVRCTKCSCTFRTQQALQTHITKFHDVNSPQSYSMVKLRDGTQIDDCECVDVEDLEVSVTEELLALQCEAAAGPSNA